MRQLCIGQPGCFLVFDAVPLVSVGASGRSLLREKLDTAETKQLVGTTANAGKPANKVVEKHTASHGIREKQPVDRQTTANSQ
jgi:hypothetical protein